MPSTRVLVVEDNHVARTFLVRVARESFSDELDFVEASDLETARRALQLDARGAAEPGDDPYGLILVGLELSDGSGLELLAQLSQYPAVRVATTLHSDDDLLFPALQCGADGYLFKEDRFEVLVEELQKIVRGQPPLSPAIARRLLGHFRQGRADGGLGRDSGFTVPGDLGGGTAPVAIEKVPEHERLTPRESEVLTYLSKGFTIKEIASLMGIKWFTVNDHIKSIYKKLNVSSRAEAAVLASKQGLV
ncbi:MAG: hypothetical protein RJA44_1224 [Pseudomonadota bacterium]